MAFVNGGLIAASRAQRATPAALRARTAPQTPAAPAPAPVAAQASSSEQPKFNAAARVFTAAAAAMLMASPAFAAGALPNNVPGISDPVLRKEAKYIEEVREGFEKVSKIEDHIAQGRWGKVEDEAKKLAELQKPLNIMSSDVFRLRERQAEGEIKAFLAEIRKLETTEDKEKAVIDFENARGHLNSFLKIAGIEFQREDSYEKYVEGKTPLLKGDQAF